MASRASRRRSAEKIYLGFVEAARKLILFLKTEVVEFNKVFEKLQFNGPRSTITLLANDNLSNAFIWAVLVVVLVSINENNQVGILLDRTGFTQITHHRTLILALFQGAVELTQSDNGIFKSFARALSPREISEISRSRPSLPPLPLINCK